MSNWEVCVNAVGANEKTGLARLFSIDRGYLETIGGRLRIVVLGWGLEIYGPLRSDA